MPVFYLDASAIAKLYLPDEIGADFVVQLLDSNSSNDTFVTSALSVVEVKSAITRRIDDFHYRISLLAAYDRDLREIFELITVKDDIVVGASSLVELHRLRAGDAIHLATALSIAAVADSQVFMVSADAELLGESQAAGIGVLDPQVDDSIDGLRRIRGLDA